MADILVRAGVGRVRVVDRDFVELANLHRQSLFDEADAAAGLPKAIAAAEKLRRANSEVDLEPIVADVNHRNVESLFDGVDCVVDGTDNFETRFLLNDAAVKLGTPWVHGGCVGAEGRSMTILPGRTACLRCLMDDCPAPGAVETCESAGILAPVVHAVAAIEAIEAIKILSGNEAAISRALSVVDLWGNVFRRIELGGLREEVDCPACRRREFPWLAGRRGSQTAVLCGRNAVQLTAEPLGAPLAELADRLAALGPVVRNAYLVRAAIGAYEITVFADGRAIVAGTDDPAVARAVYARYIGA